MYVQLLFSLQYCDGRINMYFDFYAWLLFIAVHLSDSNSPSYIQFRNNICYKTVSEKYAEFDYGDLQVTYPCWCFCYFGQLALELVEHLRAMGETNALFQRNPVSIYQKMTKSNCFSYPSNWTWINFVLSGVEKGYSFGNCSNLPVNVWVRRWIYSSNLSSSVLASLESST